MAKRKYGWRKDRLDSRDYKYLKLTPFAELPSKVDLSPQCGPVVQQNEIGSCTACSLASDYQFNLIKDNLKLFMPSRLFIYFWERFLEGTIKSDAGAELRSGIKALVKWGVCDEKIWNYSKANLFRRPSPVACKQATKNRITEYQRIPQDLQSLKTCLASGYPFVFGFSVYESFESDEVEKTGIMSMPKSNEQLEGGHAVLAIGFDDTTQTILVRNSWSDSWGLKGNFLMSYAFISDPELAADFWTIRHTTDG